MKTFNDFVSEKQQLLLNLRNSAGERVIYEDGGESAEILEAFLRSALHKAIEEYREAVRVEKRCVFESDGMKHCCVTGCDGTVENCRKCHRDKCSNKKCPLGKGVDGDSIFNSALQAIAEKDSAYMSNK